MSDEAAIAVIAAILLAVFAIGWGVVVMASKQDKNERARNRRGKRK